MNWTVYLLRGPDGKPRYVGLTMRTISERLRTHLSCKDPSRIASWVRELRSVGHSPTIETLQTLDGFTQRKAAEIVESAWVDRLRADGHDLLNRPQALSRPHIGILDGMPEEDRCAL